MYVPAKSQDELTTTPEGLRDTLERYGVAIIPGVLDDEEVDEMKQGFWQFLGQLSANCKTPITRQNKKTWSTFYSFKPMRGMLMQHWGVGHAQVLWNLRQNPKIVDIFSTLWNVPREELLVSFDGASFAFPHESTKVGEFDGTDKFHVDQAPTRPSFQCVQSWVTAHDVRPGDSTLSVIEGSHKLLGEFCETFNKEHITWDWYMLKEDEVEWYKRQGCVVRDITCPAGSMVFWDSRSIHYGKSALKDRPQRNFRAVAYLCYTPRSFATEDALATKRDAFSWQATTSHCPHDPRLFKFKPKYFKTKMNVQIPPPKLTPLGRSLAGFVDNEMN
ncbi:Phytanoyl-CoA dioxygenase (PhyH) [Seminavis robusta]|uniref:Phytanoyl-CoA dioxygenase (PhyH) n=1 Tax=Seminavis robusta TaxID=568900 RepID=A0A9N8E360_9STRA|nr:Phytanoyl-CoA dioxygenase (PhyH) [Seminavis robusta]|eukprot:Sro570_g168450.1 Phytanoyl-CoA dioxygenase (PhyH) (331) ;mRNA; r:6559-7551